MGGTGVPQSFIYDGFGYQLPPALAGVFVPPSHRTSSTPSLGHLELLMSPAPWPSGSSDSEMYTQRRHVDL